MKRRMMHPFLYFHLYNIVDNKNVIKGRLNSWVVSHLSLIICTLRHDLGREFEPRWQQTLFRTQAQHMRFIHDSIWFVWFDAIICLSNLSCKLWNRKLKIKEVFFKKNSITVPIRTVEPIRTWTSSKRSKYSSTNCAATIVAQKPFSNYLHSCKV